MPIRQVSNYHIVVQRQYKEKILTLRIQLGFEMQLTKVYTVCVYSFFNAGVFSRVVKIILSHSVQASVFKINSSTSSTAIYTKRSLQPALYTRGKKNEIREFRLMLFEFLEKKPVAAIPCSIVFCRRGVSKSHPLS